MIYEKTYDWHERVILLVEDEPECQLFFKSVFRASRVKLRCVFSGEKAISEVSKNSFIDLILMDIKLPGVDGIEASRIIKSIRPEIPIIIQTAYALGDERRRALAAGCLDYVTKPVSVDVLFDKIDHIFMTT